MGIPRIYIYCDITVTCEYHISNRMGMVKSDPSSETEKLEPEQSRRSEI